jgi:hypothetical protein
MPGARHRSAGLLKKLSGSQINADERGYEQLKAMVCYLRASAFIREPYSG